MQLEQIWSGECIKFDCVDTECILNKNFNTKTTFIYTLIWNINLSFAIRHQMIRNAYFGFLKLNKIEYIWLVRVYKVLNLCQHYGRDHSLLYLFNLIFLELLLNSHFASLILCQLLESLNGLIEIKMSQ